MSRERFRQGRYWFDNVAIMLAAVLVGVSTLSGAQAEVVVTAVSNSGTRFTVNEVVIYARGGGGGGGRGFNIAVIDPVTETVLDPADPASLEPCTDIGSCARNFDTWITRSTGSAADEMIAFLEGIPDGLVLMLATSDEAGLYTNPSAITRMPQADSILMALESLGSNLIRSYKWRSSWAMVVQKGREPWAEGIGHWDGVFPDGSWETVTIMIPEPTSLALLVGGGLVVLGRVSSDPADFMQPLLLGEARSVAVRGGQ